MSRHVAFIVVVLLILVWPGGEDDTRPDDEEPPIDVDGLHLLILHESSEPHTLTAGQREVIQSAQQAGELRQWLEANTEDFGVYDDDTNFENASEWLKDAKEVHDGMVPWLLVADADSGFAGPVPEGVDAVIELVESHAE